MTARKAPACLMVIIMLMLALEICWADSAYDEPQTASISFGAEASSGTYGTDSTTRSLYMPLKLTWLPTERMDVGIEIPIIYQSSSIVTTHVFQNNQSTTSAKTVSGRGGPGGASSGATIGVVTGTGEPDGGSIFGLGDIILRTGLVTFVETSSWPQLRPSLYVKFPTASVSKGLGTGEFDAGAGIELTKWYKDLNLTGEAFYNYQGKVAGFGLKSYASYTAGVGYQLLADLLTSLQVKGASSPSRHSGELLEARILFLWTVTKPTSLDLFMSKGVSDSSPDYGGGIAVRYWF